MVEGQDFIFFNAAIRFTDADRERQTERQGRNADDNGGQNQDMRKRI